MKFSVGTDYRVPTVVRHQGVVIVLALDKECDIYYRVLALDPAQPDDDKGWGSRRKLAFPDQLRPAGMSLVTVDLKEAERTADAPLSDGKQVNLFRQSPTGPPFQAVSDGKHVYLFRKSTAGTLYVDRFVFDAASQMLNPTWEARFQRSRKRDVPASRKDTSGARDMEGEPFFEPTTELTVVNNLQDDRFSVLLMPGRLPSEWRWQIFATNLKGEIESYSIGRGEDGLFDMADVQRCRLKWSDPGQRFQAGPAALLYMQQEEAQDEYGRAQRLKRAARVMLAAPVGSSRYALELDGVNDYVSLGKLDNLQIKGDITIEAWVKPQTGDGLQKIVAHGAGGVCLRIQDGEYQIGVGDRGASYAIPKEDEGTWVHLAGAYDSKRARWRLFRNGVRVARKDDEKGAVTDPEDWAIGESFAGQINDVRLWSVARAQKDVKRDMHRSLVGDEPGPVGYWPMDEGAGDRVHDLASENHGQLQVGRFCFLELDGTDDYVSIPSTDAINFGQSDDFTVATWIKPAPQQEDMTHGDNDVIEKWSGSDGYPFVIRYLNRTAGAREGTIWAARYDGENNPAVSSKARINDGVFHHVAFVKRSSRLALYIDGVLEATVEDSTTGETKNEGPLFIGARGGRGNFFSGQIRSVRIWDRALSVKELRKDMDTPAEEVLEAVGNWGFDEGSGATIHDRASENHGRLHLGSGDAVHAEEGAGPGPVPAENPDDKWREGRIEDPKDKWAVLAAIAILDFGVSRGGTLALIGDADAPSEVTLARGEDSAARLRIPVLDVPVLDEDAKEAPVPMPALAVDKKGLTVSAAMLRFARSGDTPFLLDGADGLVHLYFRGDDGQFLVAQYDTLTARAVYILPLDGAGAADGGARLHFTARRPGTQMQDYKIRIDGSDGKTCRVTIDGPAGVNETWENVPRALESFLAVLNGTATNDAKDPLVQEGELLYYNYGKHVRRKGVPDLASAASPFFGSTLFGVGVDKTPEGGAPILVGNVRASQVQAQTGQDNAWVPEPQGNALQFDGTDDCVKLCNDKLATTGDLTMEAWVNVGVGDGKDPHDSMCIIDYHRSEDSRCTLGLSRGAGGSGDDETLYKVSAGVWKQAVQTKNATVSPGEWTHLAAVYNATNALQLDGRGYVDCGNDATLDMTEAMTVEAWVTVAATPPKEPQVILSKWRAVAEEQSWRLYIDTDGKPCFETLDHNRRVTRVKSSEPLEAGRAYHLAGVFAASPKEEVALTLNGTSDYVRIPNDDAINFGKDDDFTVAAWIKPAPEQQDTAHSANSIIEKWSGRGSYPYAIRYLNQADTVDRGRLWAARSDRKISASVRSEKRLDDGAFHHVAFVKRGSQLALYIDGFLDATGEDGTREATTSSSPLFVGAQGGSSHFFSGQINNVRIWSRSLSTEEIREDMDTPASQVADAVGNWACDKMDQLLEKAQDRSGRGNEGEPVGCTFDDVDKCEYEQRIYVDGQLHGWGLISRGKSVGWLDRQTDATVFLIVPHDLAPTPGDVLLLQDRQVLVQDVTEHVVPLPMVGVTAVTVNGLVDGHPYFTSVYQLQREANTVQSTTTEVNIGRSASEEGNFQGTIDDVRVWKVGRRAWQIQQYHDQPLPGDAEGLVGHWRFEDGGGATATDSKGSNHGRVIHPETAKIPEMWAPSVRSAALSLYVNGQRVDVSDTQDVDFGDPQFSLGAKLADGTYQQHMAGIIDELRLWNAVRTREQIRDNAYRSLSGEEEDLAGYWPLDEGEGGTIRDLTGNGQDGSLAGSKWIDSTAPIGNEGPEVRNVYGGLPKPGFNQQVVGPPAAVEYGDVQWDAEGNLFGVLKRCYLFQEMGPGVIQLVTGFKIGDLETNYIGQVQTAPTLIGYIEGAPPVPSENLTVRDADYADTSAIQLTEAKETTQVYSASRDSGFDMSVDVKAGLYFTTEAEGGFGYQQKLLEAESKIGLHAYFEYALGWLSDASVAAGTSKTLTKSLTLRGDWEKPEDDDQERQARYLNPEVGRRYIPNNMGYALVKSGTADLFALRLKRTSSLVAYQLLPNPDIPEDWNIIMFPLNPRYVKNGTLDGMVGLVADSDYPHADAGERGSYFRPLEAYALKEQIEREAKQIAGYYEGFDIGKLARRGQLGTGSLMERLPEQELGYDWETGRDKRNMVNTYVWTADGGFYAEEEQFSSVRQESRGGSFHFLGQVGFVADLKFAVTTGTFVEVDALFGGHLDVTASQSKEESAAFGMTVDLQGEGRLNKWKGDPEGQEGSYTAEPCPGKVDAYRFMTFYLAPKPENFDRFFDEVVDPDWLNGQGKYVREYSPNARALREARYRPNELWRVMHRVTYVSRIPPKSEHVPVEAVPKDVRRPTNIMANIGLIKELARIRCGMRPRPKESQLVILGRAADRLLMAGGGTGQGKLADTIPWWADVQEETKKEIRQDVMAYLKGYYEEEDEKKGEPARLGWKMAVEHRPSHLQIFAGSLPCPGIELTVTDPYGNATSVTSGSKSRYGEGGFEVLVHNEGTYTLTFLDQKFEVEREKIKEEIIVTLTQRA